MDPNLIKYLPGMMKIGYQRIIYNMIKKKAQLTELIKIL